MPPPGVTSSRVGRCGWPWRQFLPRLAAPAVDRGALTCRVESRGPGWCKGVQRTTVRRRPSGVQTRRGPTRNATGSCCALLHHRTAEPPAEPLIRDPSGGPIRFGVPRPPRGTAPLRLVIRRRACTTTRLLCTTRRYAWASVTRTITAAAPLGTARRPPRTARLAAVRPPRRLRRRVPARTRRTTPPDGYPCTVTTVLSTAGSVWPILSACSDSASGRRAPTSASRLIRPAATSAIASG